jgi:response regulator RpfG family c-di-GMP phosphodiesterase
MKSVSDIVVLFVDDESDVLSSLRRFLRKEPFSIIFAESGDKALEMMASQPVAIIVSDLRMPEMDGLTLLNVVKVRYPDTKRLILSATTDREEIVDAIDSGDVFRFIQKPLEPEPFKQAIRDAVDFYLLEKVFPDGLDPSGD